MSQRRSSRNQSAAPSYKEPVVEEEDSSSEEEAESPQRSSKRKSPSQPEVRKAAQVATPKAKKSPPNPSTTPKAKKTPAKSGAQGSEDSLLELISTKPNAIPMAAMQFWEDESSNRELAVGRVIRTILQASGCNEKLSNEIFSEDRDIDDDVRAIEQSTTHVKSILSGKDHRSKKLRPNMSEFWRKIIIQASDDNILEFSEHPLLRWLFALSTSQLKDIRFGASFAVIEMMLALLTKANEVLDSINKLDRLVNAGGAAKNRNKEQLQSRMSMKAAMEGLMDQFFNSLFVHRLRDVDADIRTRSIDCIGQCVANYKTKFLDNTFLKYLGWALYDKDYSVRGASVNALKSLYETNQVTELEMFTNRFRERLVEMRLDINEDVANATLQLLTTMSKANLLSKEDNEAVYRMLIEDSSAIRDSAAAFINAAYLEGVLTPIYEEAVAGGARTNKDETLLKGLIEMVTMIIGSEIVDSTVSVMVQALLPFMPMLQDWSLVHKILEEDGDDPEILAPEDKAMLAKFLVAALQASRESSSSDAKAKGKTKKSDIKGDFSKGSIFLSTVLSSLLKKFSADQQTLKGLVQIPVFLDLDSLTQSQKQPMQDAVNTLVDISSKEQDTELLTLCAESLAVINLHDYPLKPTLSAIVDNYIDSVRSDMAKILEMISKNTKLTSTHLLKLKKCSVMASSLDIFSHDNDMPEQICQVLKKLTANADNSQTATVIQHLVSMVSLSVLWRSKFLIESKDSDASTSVIKSNIKSRDLSFKKLVELASADLPAAIRLQICLAIGDVMKIYGDRNEAAAERKIGIQLPSRVFLEALKVIESAIEPILSQEGEIPALEDLKETVSDLSLPFDQEDRNGVHKIAALALVTPVVYHPFTGEEGNQAMTDAMCTALLHTPYGSEFQGELSEVVGRVLTDWKVKLSCFQKMYNKILSKAQAKEDVEELTTALIDAVSSITLDTEVVEAFIWDGYEWSIQGMPQSLGFLDVLSLQIKFLPSVRTKSLLSKMDELCASEGLSLSGKVDPRLEGAVKFRNKMIDHLKSFGSDGAKNSKSPAAKKVATSDRSEILETPSKTAKLSRGIDDDDARSDQVMSTPAQSTPRNVKEAKSSGRKPASQGKQQKRKIEDEQDEEGFVATKRAR